MTDRSTVHTTHQTKTATNSAKIHSLARKNEHLRINQIQLRFLHFNQHSIALLGIHMRHSLRKKSASLNPPSKLLCRNLAITELSVSAIVHKQPLGVVNCISVLNKIWNTCIYAFEAVSTKACILAPASLMTLTGAQIQRICNSKDIILTTVAFIWVLSFISLISYVFLLIMACLCLVAFSYIQKFSLHCLVTKFNFQARFLENRAKQFH